MSKPIERNKANPGIHRRRRYVTEEKIRLVEQTMQPGMSVGTVASLYGICPSLIFKWRRRMGQRRKEAVAAETEAVSTNEEVVPISFVRELENRIRELERVLGRTTMETEILREALERARSQLDKQKLGDQQRDKQRDKQRRG